ncbi:MAG: hypothetical protein U1F43_00315 [Myxococcota bacterium]
MRFMTVCGVQAVLVTVGFSMLGAACGDDAKGEPAPVDCNPGVGGKPVGCVFGTLVDTKGKPLSGVKVSACTDVECIRADTAADGTYDIQGLQVAAHHIEVLGDPKGVATMVWWQAVPAGVQSRLKEPVVLQPLAGITKVPWLPDDGGTVTLADGRLELTAEPGTLKYAAGTVAADKAVLAIELDIDDIPPYDIEPWKGKESKSMAFVVNPFPLKASAPIKVKVLGETGVAAGTPYTLYVADPVFGNLERAGILTADGSGALVSESGMTLQDLTTLVIVPN